MFCYICQNELEPIESLTDFSDENGNHQQKCDQFYECINCNLIFQIYKNTLILI